MISPERQLAKALTQVGAFSHQVVMAAFLLRVNGLENALEFVRGLQERGLTTIPKRTINE